MSVAIQEVIHHLLQLNSKQVGQGVSEEAIIELEARLGVQLPHSYKAFLKVVGWAVVGFYEIYGWGKDVPKHLDVLQVTEWERSQSGNPLPYYLIPIFNNGAGDYHCLATHQRRRNECPVVLWLHELPPNQNLEWLARDFSEWLHAIIVEAHRDN